MAIESRIFDSTSFVGDNEIIQEKEAFGWELLSIASNRFAMSRNTDRKHYDELYKLEKDYNAHMKTAELYYKQSKVNGFLVFILFLLLIFPGIIYLIQKSKIKGRIAKHRQRALEIIAHARSLVFDKSVDNLNVEERTETVEDLQENESKEE